ncbi:MAG: AAA family ATPase [Actinomycetota bacterium]|nr:AAA family ATPase [Actinomycetota bacterium]
MEFRILGPLEVLDEERTLDVARPPKQRALLAVLLLNANQVVSKDILVDSLWGDEPPGTSSKAIQVYVSQLRNVLGKKRLETKAPGYLLRVHDHELDLHRFEALREQAKQTDSETASALLHEALALWRGPPLGEFAYDGFARLEIARLEELHLACLEERIEADLALGRHSDLVGELEGLVAEHPLRERLRAQLMLALYRSGRQAEALEAYQDARRVLVGELGIQPGKSLRELEKAILQQDPSVDLGPAGVETTAATDTSRGIFVGREAEFRELRAGLDAAVAGQGRLFLLEGEPGIGKSRLAEELMGHARARGVRVLVGRCWEAGGAPAYWPWVQSLRAYVQDSDPEALRTQLGAGGGDVAQIVPELRELFPDLAEPVFEGEGARFRLFDAAARFLQNAAAARPLVLVLDDLHAADEPSLLLLRFLAGELAGSRILVVGTYRDVDPTVRDPLASTLAELAREQVTRRVVLGGLTEADVGRYLELSVSTRPPSELIATIYTETEGNPLFVGEVIRLLAPEGRLSEVEIPVLWTLGVPQGVREVIGQRLRRLSDQCVLVLTLASVLGRDFGLDALERLSELPVDELLEILDEAVTERLLTSVPGARGRLRFAHALIRETLYDQLTTPRRVQLHRRAGEALEDLYAMDPEPHLAELAHHFFEAAPGGDVSKALEYARRAGDGAIKLLAYEEAARLYELALQALEARVSVDPVSRCELRLALGAALGKAGSTPEANEAFLAAAELARTSGLWEHLGRAALGYEGSLAPWLRAGSKTRLVPLLEEALNALGDEESALRVRLMARLAGALRDQPSLEPRSSLSRRAVEIARRLGDLDALGYALWSFATATWSPEIEELAATAEEVTRVAEETNDAERALQALWPQYVAAVTLGELGHATRCAEEYSRRADELKQPSQQWYGTVLRSHLALFQGEFAEAEMLLEKALQIGGRAQTWDAGFSYRIALFQLRRDQGRLEEIEDLTRQSVDEYSGYRSFRCLVALISCELGHDEEGRSVFDELATADFAGLPRDSEWLFCLSILAEVASYLEDDERVAILYGLLLPYASLNALSAGELIIGSVARYLGILASTMSQWDDAARHFEDALAMNAGMGGRPWLANTQQDYARMLLVSDPRGNRQAAQRLLTEALATYGQLGMATSAASASALMADAGLIA